MSGGVGIVGDFTTMIQRLVAAQLYDVNTGIPAHVTSYDRKTQTCSAQPVIPHAFIDETGQRMPDPLPTITNVPVAFVGAGANSITYELYRGDIVWLQFAQRRIDTWMHRGGGNADSEDDRTHDLNDAVATIGPRNLSSALPADAVSPDAMVIRFEKQLRIGSAAAGDGVVRFSDAKKIADALTTAITVLQSSTIMGTALAAAITAASDPSTGNPQTVITLGFLKTTLLVDPSAGALQALKDALAELGFPSSSTEVRLR